MKTFTKYLSLLSAAALSLMAVSCAEDGYVAGEQDLENCPDVFFNPEQSGHYAFGISDDIQMTFKVSRNNTEGYLDVPLEIKGEEEFITVTSLEFEDGQPEAEIVVIIDNIEIQKKYEYEIHIPSPEYGLIYGFNETSLTFSVIKEDYTRYASGKYACEFFTAPRPVTLEYSEMLDLYRISGVWETGCHPLVFKWDGKENVSFEEGASFYTAIDFGEGFIYADPEGASYDSGEKKFTFDLYYNIPGLGGYSIGPDTFTLN